MSARAGLCGALRLDSALVEPFDPCVKIGAGVDQALRGFGQLCHDRLIALLRMTEPSLGAAPVAVWNLANSMAR